MAVTSQIEICTTWKRKREGIILLSAPIGTPAFIERIVNEVVAKYQRLLDAVVAFAVDDWDHAVQGANLLLRYCESPRFLYWCRLLAPSPPLLAAARAHDAAKVTAFTSIHRTGALSTSAHRQVQLPIRLGGFGLVSSARVAPGAYLGSVAVTVGDVWDLRRRAAARLVGLGELSRAASRLTSAPVAAANQQTLDQLRALHPDAAPIDRPAAPAEDAPRLETKRDFLLAALKTAPRGAAAGPTCWRYEHLQVLLGEAHTNAEAVPVLKFVQRMLDGDLPPLVTRLLAAARLFALEKPGGGVRPIAIGDVLRRWVTRALCMQHKLEFEEEFRPHQFAVGMSAGGEKLFRAAQTYIQTQDPGG
ncbi:unnamed protein product [Vitrella brassicaformis CCMP3155]|uniref:Uncharacterized protein n=1 Tax=Vitrella brassicaformis (strain CCMP3155) TaxID=1169540 RepID=A0A0G4G3F0_VITBC|nr:unnamed protein product [Vitrella brassicaformis CCMP3155]|eukprot:CEM22781.1 unnamed protein product [Vitrella brassicaformis CCMP3155]